MAGDSTGHDELRDLAAVYILGALAPDEREAFEAHLSTCPECAAEVRSLSPAAGALAQIVPMIDPPAPLRARVLAAIGASDTRALTARTSIAAWSPWLAMAASLVIAVMLAGYAASLRGQIATLEGHLREAIRRAEASELQIADARRAAADAQSQVAVLAAPDLARVDLNGLAPAPQAAGRAFWSRSRGLVFTASNLPPLPAGRTYQLWVLPRTGAPYGAGLLLKPDPNGRVTVVFSTPADLPAPKGMAVTIEPEGGVPAPTGGMYLLGNAN